MNRYDHDVRCVLYDRYEYIFLHIESYGLVSFKVSSLCRAGMFDLGEAYPEAYPLEMLLL